MKHLLVLMAVAMLSACTKDIVYVDRYTVSYVGMDEAWLTACPILPPPKTAVYDTASEVEKRYMWTNVYLEQVSALAAKNLALKEAREYNRKKVGTVVTTCSGTPCE